MLHTSSAPRHSGRALCENMSAKLHRFYPVVVGAALLLTSGCVCRDGVTTARKVALRVQPCHADVTLKTGSRGQQHEVTPDDGGIYRFDIPSLRWADHVWLGFIKVRTRGDDAEPLLYVLRPDGRTSEFSARQISRLPADTDGVPILKLRR